MTYIRIHSQCLCKITSGCNNSPAHNFAICILNTNSMTLHNYMPYLVVLDGNNPAALTPMFLILK